MYSAFALQCLARLLEVVVYMYVTSSLVGGLRWPPRRASYFAYEEFVYPTRFS